MEWDGTRRPFVLFVCLLATAATRRIHFGEYQTKRKHEACLFLRVI